MTRKDAEDWLITQNPVTLVLDRYYGAYSNARWLAFPLEANEIPNEIYDEDVPCMCFWGDYNEPVGKGMNPADAYFFLVERMIEISK